ncbi:MAG: hypothetical protein RL247_512 [Actinomycetota bacterium]
MSTALRSRSEKTEAMVIAPSFDGCGAMGHGVRNPRFPQYMGVNSSGRRHTLSPLKVSFPRLSPSPPAKDFDLDDYLP